MSAGPAYWPSAWPAEDGGPRRQQVPHDTPGLGIAAGESLTATFRMQMATTMAVWRDPGELYLLTHEMGPDTTARVERIDPVTLEPLVQSPVLPAGPMWPGGLAVHADGHLLSVYGRWAHRLDPETLAPVVARELPQPRPYNSFVLLADGTLATKDFAKDGDAPSQLLALDPVTLEPRAAELPLPERSIARLSADGNTLYVVGDTHLWRLAWDGTGWELDPVFAPRYRTLDGQTYGWDAVLTDGAAWFLDDGEGSDRYVGTFHGQGISEAPLHLVRVDLETGAVALHEVCGLPGGLIANPPVVDETRGIALAYDSGNGALVAFDVRADGTAEVRWRREQDHACHMVLWPDTGEVLTHHHDREAMAEHAVVLRVDDGEELARVATGSPVQSALFPAPGADRDVYSCTFAGISRIAVTPAG